MGKRLEASHIPLWLIKDCLWFLGFGELSLLFAIPTIIISLILIYIKKSNDRVLEIMMGFWLTANTLWMSHELLHTNTKGMALIMFCFGILLFPWYLLNIKD